MSNLIQAAAEGVAADPNRPMPGRLNVERSVGRQEGMPNARVIAFPADGGAGKDAREDALTDLIGDMMRMSSVLASLVEDRIRDTGNGPFAVTRRDAADVSYVAAQARDLAERVQQAWEAI